MRFLLILILVLFLTGCKTPQPVIERTVTITETETVRDTTVVTEPDTASIKALFECDSLNQVVLTELEIEKGRKTVPQVRFKDRWFEVAVPVDSESVYFSWKEKHKLETEQVIVTKIVKEKYEPPWYRKILSWIGLIALVVLLVILKFKPTWFLKILKML